MIRIRNECCDCAVPGYPCLGTACPNRRVEVHYCDECGEELDELPLDGIDICWRCKDGL